MMIECMMMMMLGKNTFIRIKGKDAGRSRVCLKESERDGRWDRSTFRES